MSTLEALFLGIVQGLTEFLPVSSSGHLVLFQTLLGMENLKNYIVFDIFCHLGTLLAICIVFADKIKAILTQDRSSLLKLFVALLPLFPLVFFLKPIKAIFDQPQYLGYFFLITSGLLYAGIRFGKEAAASSLQHPWRDALTIGCFQAIAVFPGVSRSGSTISGARLLGWNEEQAIQFSFLLAIPTILASVVLEFGQLIFHQSTEVLPSISWIQYTIGFIFSFIFGFFSLRVLQRLASKQRFMYFVWYCLMLGIILIICL